MPSLVLLGGALLIIGWVAAIVASLRMQRFRRDLEWRFPGRQWGFFGPWPDGLDGMFDMWKRDFYTTEGQRYYGWFLFGELLSGVLFIVGLSLLT
jgi:hypothetical protein